jgi:hypothetical protein
VPGFDEASLRQQAQQQQMMLMARHQQQNPNPGAAAAAPYSNSSSSRPASVSLGGHSATMYLRLSIKPIPRTSVRLLS